MKNIWFDSWGNVFLKLVQCDIFQPFIHIMHLDQYIVHVCDVLDSLFVFVFGTLFVLCIWITSIWLLNICFVHTNIFFFVPFLLIKYGNTYSLSNGGIRGGSVFNFLLKSMIFCMKASIVTNFKSKQDKIRGKNIA